MLRDPLDYFPNFLWKTWQSIGLPEPTPLQYDMAHYLMDGRTVEELKDAASRGDIGARKILAAFRGAAKSYVNTTFGVYRLRINREEIVLATSATAGFASSIATFAFNMVRGFDWLADMKPRSDQRQSALAFDVDGAPVAKDESFAAASIFGQITGRRASLIMGDDLETPNTSDTEANRQQLRNRMSEFGAIIKPGGDIYLMGTPQTEQTIYKEYADEKGYELRFYPVLYPRPSADPKKDELRKYGTRLAPFIAKPLLENPLLAGTSTEPTRFSEADIAGRKLEWGAVEFERQFLMWMDAGGGKGNPLKLRDLIVLDIPKPNIHDPIPRIPTDITFSPLPAYAHSDISVDALSGDSHVYSPVSVDNLQPCEEVVCTIDPSGEGTDETSWSIVGTVAGRVALLHQGNSLDGHADSVLKQIAQDCSTWSVQTVEVESNFGGGMFSSLLRPHLTKANCKADIVDRHQGRQGGHKEKRIVETLEPLMTSHRLIINAQVLRQDFTVDYPSVEKAKRSFYRLTHQLTRMTKQRGALKQDDRADSLSRAAAYFVERFQLTLDEANKKTQDEALQLEIEKIIKLRREQGLPLYGLDEKNNTSFGRGYGRKVKP